MSHKAHDYEDFDNLIGYLGPSKLFMRDYVIFFHSSLELQKIFSYGFMIVTDTPRAKPPAKTETTIDQIGSNVCGIVMPIAPMSDDYSAAHWARVRKILEKAITEAKFHPKVVWDNPDVAVIQSKILKNIYENEVIICDLSNLNSNVMLEAGLRLSTKKPTILVTDGEKKPPFDIASIEYISYPKNLEYNQIDLFIKNLSERISTVANSYRLGTYKSFVDSYQFEIARPSTIEIPAEQYLAQQIDELKSLFIANMTEKNCDQEIIEKIKVDNFERKALKFKIDLSNDDLNSLIKDFGFNGFVSTIKYKVGRSGINHYMIIFNTKATDLICNLFEETLRKKGATFL